MAKGKGRGRRARQAKALERQRKSFHREKDPRILAFEAEANPGLGIQEGAPITIVAMVRLADGELDGGGSFSWATPEPVTFHLLHAAKLRDQGVRMRRSIMGNLTRDSDGTLAPLDDTKPLDCVSLLSAAVVLSFVAVEASANGAIASLDDDTTLEFKGKTYGKDQMLSLSIADKYKRVIPLKNGRRPADDSKVWRHFRHLKDLRNELVHVTNRGYQADEAKRTAYDRLLLGEGDRCVEEAILVIQAARPGSINTRARRVLGMQT